MTGGAIHPSNSGRVAAAIAPVCEQARGRDLHMMLDDGSAWQKVVCVHLPAAALLAWLLVIAAVEWLATAPSYFTGSGFPYISDVGRDGVNYWIFSIGGTLATCPLLAQLAWLGPAYATRLQHEAEAAADAEAADALASVATTWKASCAMSSLACVFLILLACLSTSAFPAAHDYSAYAFFLLMGTALPIFTRGSETIARLLPEAAPPSSVALKRGLCASFLAAAVLYLPVGLSIVCSWDRVPLAACRTWASTAFADALEGDAYCEAKVLPSSDDACREPPCVALWDYSGCPASNVMRAVTQLLCVLCLIGFQSTFVFENRWLLFRDADGSSRFVVAAWP